MLGHDDHRVGAARNYLRESLENSPLTCATSVFVIDNAQEVAAPVSHHERQALGQSQDATLAELRVHEVVVLTAQLSLHLRPSPHIVHKSLGSVEVKDTDLNSACLQEVGLAFDEICGARLIRRRPL